MPRPGAALRPTWGPSLNRPAPPACDDRFPNDRADCRSSPRLRRALLLRRKVCSPTWSKLSIRNGIGENDLPTSNPRGWTKVTDRHERPVPFGGEPPYGSRGTRRVEEFRCGPKRLPLATGPRCSPQIIQGPPVLAIAHRESSLGIPVPIFPQGFLCDLDVSWQQRQQGALSGQSCRLPIY